ncbi:hypothetical protein C6500_15875 [Candidatus Poribacteria bacterium]|nr:MAG: hypothetical protein C6500_15875 [Candidatus Poribacteria bacterium]
MKCLIFLLLLLPIFSASAGWESVESPHFRVYYKEGTVDPVSILRISEEFYAELPQLTSRMPAGMIDIWVCDTQKEFQASVHAPIQDWAVGCAFPLSRRIVILNPKHIALAKLQLVQVLRHEIAHVLFGQCTRKTVREIPLWFIEGIAIYFAEEWVPSRHETLLKHIFSRSILPLHELERSFPRTQAGADLAYAESQDTVRWLVEVKGRDVLFSLIAELHAGSNFSTAFETVVGWDLATYDILWRESLTERYQWASLFSNSYVLWGGFGGLALIGYLVCWNRRRRHLNKLAQQENSIDPFFRF